jgi:hypothetical protein
MLAWRVFPAASAAGVIAFSLVLLMGEGRALATPGTWWSWVGQGDPNNINDPLNWQYYVSGSSPPFQNPTNVQQNIFAGTNEPAGTDNRWGFTGGGGWSTAFTNWYDGAPPGNPSATSIYYPSVANPSTCNIGPGYAAIFTNPSNNSGDIDGDMHVNVNGGTLSVNGDLYSTGEYGLPLYAAYENSPEPYSQYMWNNSIDVSNGGTFTAGNVYGASDGLRACGDITLGIHGSATVNLTSFTAGHANTAGGPALGQSVGQNQGMGGGGLTLEGAGGSINIGTVALLPSSPANPTGHAAFCQGAALNVLLDSSCISTDHVVSFNTVQTNALEIDPTYTLSSGTQLSSAVNLQVTLEGYTPVLGDVIPVISVSGGTAGLCQYNGTSTIIGSLGNITFNGQAINWGQQFGVGAFEFTGYQYDPDNPSQAGVYLEVTAVPEPSTIVLLGIGVVGAAVGAWRRKVAPRVFRAASAASVIAFSLVLLMGEGRALAAQGTWWSWVGQGDPNNINDPLNWQYYVSSSSPPFQNPTNVQQNIFAGTNEPAGTDNRWGFTGGGGWSAAFPDWYDGAPPGNPRASSIYYPSVANPSTCNIGPGYAAIFANPNNNSGDIDGDMHVNVNGGTLSVNGDLSSTGLYGLPLYAAYEDSPEPFSTYMWKNSIDVSNGGTFTAGNVYGVDGGGQPACGDITLGVHGSATVDLTSFTAGHAGGAGGPAFGQSVGQNNGMGGGGLTLEGAGGSINIGTIALLPSSPANPTGHAAFCQGAALNVLLDSSCVSTDHVVSFNTVQTNALEIDPTYTLSSGTQLSSAVNLQVTLEGYTPVLGDVIPVISVSGGTAGLCQYNGTSTIIGSLGNININGQAINWGQQFGMDLDPETFDYLYGFTAYQYNPDNPSQAGVYLEVTMATPEPNAIVLLGVGGSGAAAVVWRRKRRAG